MNQFSEIIKNTNITQTIIPLLISGILLRLWPYIFSHRRAKRIIDANTELMQIFIFHVLESLSIDTETMKSIKYGLASRYNITPNDVDSPEKTIKKAYSYLVTSKEFTKEEKRQFCLNVKKWQLDTNISDTNVKEQSPYNSKGIFCSTSKGILCIWSLYIIIMCIYTIYEGDFSSNTIEATLIVIIILFPVSIGAAVIPNILIYCIKKIILWF
jgi:hypothetical protein